MHATISGRTLLAIYAVIPLGLLLILIDKFVLDGALLHSLPLLQTATPSPAQYLWFAVLFPLPHIFMSFVSFLDKDYLIYYRAKLLWGIPIIAAIAFVLSSYFFTLAVITLAITTIVHTAFQQAGIALMLMRMPFTLLARCWKYMTGILGILSTAIVFPLPLPSAITGNMIVKTTEVALALFLCLTLYIIITKRREASTISFAYFIGTAFVPFLSLLAIGLHYAFIAILVPRLIHDLTAFYFYLTHERGRNGERPRNAVAQLFSLPINTYLALLTFTMILLSYFFVRSAQSTIFTLYFISTLHYYVEAFMWKKGTPHRAAIAFSI